MQLLVALASKLIGFENTEAERINRCAEFCKEWLNEHGVSCETVENEGLRSVVATVGSGSPTVLLNGHLDVVPGSPEDFVPRVEGGSSSVVALMICSAPSPA
ncbi:M20 family metallopeptidase [Paenibacillus beijingensis]|uniref:M20 family metallopeptidase n=1 Tax=Paenibacillus beijingensis TaxID=1126833 RepID=UPI000A4DEF5E|nr:M20 family metallopeptidase [Paenibacillus beijingensis]